MFAQNCDKEKIAQLSEIDQEGIKDGVVKKGMTKEGVVYAVGYPPTHKTPTLDSDQWIYWKNRFGKMRVQFTDGKVSRVIR